MSDTLLSILADDDVRRLRDGYDYAVMRQGFHKALYEPYEPGAHWVEGQVAHFYEGESAAAPTTGHTALKRRTVLAPMERERILIGLLAAEGGSALAIHLYWGLALGLEVAEVVDILFLAGTYTGVKAYNLSLNVAGRTFRALAALAQAEDPKAPLGSAAVLGALGAAFA